MNIGGGEAADQLVRMMLTGTEVAVRLSGSAVKNVLALSLALAKNHKRISGKVNLGKMLRETRDLRQFPMTPEQYRQFQILAKRQKLLYSSIHDRDDRGRLIDVILPVTELDRANQIFQRMLYQEPSQHKDQRAEKQAEKPDPDRQERPEQVREKGQRGGKEKPPGEPCGPESGGSSKKRFSVGTRLARYKNQLLYVQREREFRMTHERPSVLERLKVYRTQLDQRSAPARQKIKKRQKAR